MATRVDIPVTRLDRAGIKLADSETALVNGEGGKFLNDGRTFLVLRNSGAGEHIITIVTAGSILGLPIEDLVKTIVAGASYLIGPFPKPTFNLTTGADHGRVYVNSDGTQSEMKCKAVRL
jgi:hypothetical protein